MGGRRRPERFGHVHAERVGAGDERRAGGGGEEGRHEHRSQEAQPVPQQRPPGPRPAHQS